MNSGQNRICDLNRDGYGSAIKKFIFLSDGGRNMFVQIENDTDFIEWLLKLLGIKK